MPALLELLSSTSAKYRSIKYRTANVAIPRLKLIKKSKPMSRFESNSQGIIAL
jgi:hypothetical protein